MGSDGIFSRIPGLVNCHSLQWNMAIDIVDFPMKNGDFSWQNVSSPEGIWDLWDYFIHILGDTMVI